MNTINATLRPVAGNINLSDTISASIEAGGRTLAQVCRGNFASIEEVTKYLSRLAGAFMGLAMLKIRNMTQGWSVSLTLATRRGAATAATGHITTNKASSTTKRVTAPHYYQPSLFATAC